MKLHNDKFKECDEKVNIAKAEKQDVLTKCNGMMEKVTRMELVSNSWKKVTSWFSN